MVMGVIQLLTDWSINCRPTPESPGKAQARIEQGSDPGSAARVDHKPAPSRARLRRGGDRYRDLMSAATGAQEEARRYGRTAGLLSAGIGAAGLITYLYFALASHSLSRSSYGAIVVLWSAVVVTISVLYRPVEQLLSRTLAERRARGQSVRRTLRIAAAIQLGIAAACAATALALRGPLSNGLLEGRHGLYVVLVIGITAYGASYYARGFLAGTGRFSFVAALLLSEASGRCAFALAVTVGLASGQTAVAAGIAFAPLFSLVVVPLALIGERRRRRQDVPKVPTGPSAESEFTLGHGSSFAAAVLLIMLSEQTFLNGGPLLVRGADGAAAAGFIFNVLLVARAPLLLFQGIATSLLPHLTRLRSQGGKDAFELSIRQTLRAIAAFGILAVVVMAAIGPQLMQIAFGHKFEYDRFALILVSAGMGLYLAAATLNQAALAQGQVRRAAACWVGCAIAFLVWNLLPVLSDFRRVELGFAGAAATLCALLFALYRNPSARPADVIAPGSPAEIEARLAAAEEAG